MMTREDQITHAAALSEKSPVFIQGTDASGDWCWAVALVDDPEFWMNAFHTKEEALEYCRKHALPVTSVTP